MKQYIVAIDAGTTGIRVIAFGREGNVAAQAYSEFKQIFPRSGWVEHDPSEIWGVTAGLLREVADKIGKENINSIGITNQRETTVVWDRENGRPLYNAIVWQCRRTADICSKLKDKAGIIREKTGLFLDPYFSATKIKWLVDNVDGVRRSLHAGKLCFGTIDSWLIWNLTGGKVHATEASNASRTLCFNINSLQYDNELLDIFSLPSHIFPEVKDSNALFGATDKSVFGSEVPIAGSLGDQQAALFAHGGWREGVVKNTYGTGLFVVKSTGGRVSKSDNLINTIAWKIDGKVTYAIEGSIFVGGSAIQWLRDGIGIIKSAQETEELAKKIGSNEGVYFVPALTGLGAPYWDPTARGIFTGLTRSITREHLVRAALESMAYQTRDVIEEAKKGVSGFEVSRLGVDGGASKNDFLMQFQADLLGIEVERPEVLETTALGAAGISGISTGFWTQDEFLRLRRVDKVFKPNSSPVYESYYARWKEAVQKSLGWDVK